MRPRLRATVLSGDYVRLWSAQGISAFGSQISVLALPLVAILTLDATAFEVAVLTAIELVPFIFISIPAGVWVDRLRRRPILVSADIGRGVSLLSIPVAYGLDSLTLPHLYAVGPLNGVLTVFFTVAYQAYVPSLVERDRLVEANARFEATETLARLAGPGFNRTIVWGVSPLGALLGGGLAASAGLRIAILVGAAIAFAAAIPALASPLRSLRRLPEPGSLAS